MRETYNSNRFEPVTKPASWSSLGSAGKDAILRESIYPGLTHTFNPLFDILSFKRIFTFILCRSIVLESVSKARRNTNYRIFYEDTTLESCVNRCLINFEIRS